MSPARKILALSWRALVTVLLLAWIFNAIFAIEASQIAKSQNLDWDHLPRLDQWHMAWRHGPGALWQTLTGIEPWALAASLVLMGATLGLGILRWRLVLRVQGLNLPLSRAAEISFVAHFFNSFLLGSTGGDLMKAYYAARETRHKKTEAVVTVFVDRIIGLWAMLVFASLMMIPNFDLLTQHPKFRTLAGFILALTAGGTGFLVVAFWGGISKAWSGARPWLRRLPKGEYLERSLESCRDFGRAPGLLAQAAALSMLLNVFCTAQFWVICQGLHLAVSPVVLLCAVPSIIFVSALPVTPSGLGVRENLFVLVLAHPTLHVAATGALSLSLLAYAGSLLWSLAGGGVYLLFKERHHLDAVKAEPV